MIRTTNSRGDCLPLHKEGRSYKEKNISSYGALLLRWRNVSMNVFEAVVRLPLCVSAPQFSTVEQFLWPSWRKHLCAACCQVKFLLQERGDLHKQDVLSCFIRSHGETVHSLSICIFVCLSRTVAFSAISVMSMLFQSKSKINPESYEVGSS